MEVVEDDVFFADLSKRISLLIMDDDEDPIAHCPPVSFQAFSQAIHPIHNQPPSFHEINCRREIKGTGVFIPRSSTNPRSRKNKQSRFNSSNTRFLKNSDNPRGHLPHDQPFHNHNITNTSHNSLNNKRC